MANAGKITPAIERSIVAHSLAGKSGRAIAVLVQREHGVKLSNVAVSAFLRAHRTELAEQTKVVTREVARKGLPSILDVHNRKHRRLLAHIRKIERALERRPTDQRLNRTYSMLLGRHCELLALTAKHAGVDVPDAPIASLKDFLELAQEDARA